MNEEVKEIALVSHRDGSELLSAIELNYQAAQNYYIQKKVQFLKMLANKVNMEEREIEEKLVESMNLLITEQWQKINEQVLANVDVYQTRSGSYNIKENVNWVNIPETLRERILEQAPKKGNIYSILGLYYEEWLEESFKRTAEATASSAYQSILSQFLSSFNQTGAIKSDSSIRGNNLSIRPDLGMNIDETGKDIETGLTAELQTVFNIESNRLANSSNLNMETEDTQRIMKYLQSNMFGFSVKRWVSASTATQRVLTSASGIQRMINNKYKSGQQGKTWNVNYAYRTMLHIISQYLLDILGPVNIAYITGVEFMWADEFLADSLLTMNIYSKLKPTYSEVLEPYISSNHIYIQHFVRGRQFAIQNRTYTKAAELKGKDNGNKWNAYQLRFAIKEKG